MTDEEIKTLLTKISRIPIVQREATILNIGGRGYYENPMSDLLAFFLNPRAGHDLGTLVLSSLLDILGRPNLNPELVGPPIREQVNRIDIVLPGDGFVIALENKVRHGLNNPFQDYRAAIDREFGEVNEENRICCILAPVKPDPGIGGWTWVDTRSLISKVWDGLARRLRDTGFSKWGVLLREFLLTLEQELESTMDLATLKNRANIYPDLVKADSLRRQFIDELKRKLTEISVEIVRSGSLSIGERAWKGVNAVALRMYPHMNDPQNATFLLFDGRDKNDPPYAVQFYRNNPINRNNSINCPFKLSGEEEVSGITLHFYRSDYSDMEEAFKGFEEALRYIMPAEA